MAKADLEIRFLGAVLAPPWRSLACFGAGLYLDATTYHGSILLALGLGGFLFGWVAERRGDSIH